MVFGQWYAQYPGRVVVDPSGKRVSYSRNKSTVSRRAISKREAYWDRKPRQFHWQNLSCTLPSEVVDKATLRPRLDVDVSWWPKGAEMLEEEQEAPAFAGK